MITLKIKDCIYGHIFEESFESVDNAIYYLRYYETLNKTFCRHYEINTGNRIIGGKLEKIS